MNLKKSGIRPSRIKSRARREKSNLILVLLQSVVCGAGTALLLLVVFAQLFARTEWPLEMMRGFSCTAAAFGTMAAALVLARGVQQKRLLCGLGCGAFCCMLLLGVTLLSGRIPAIDRTNASMLAAVLLGGALGGGVSALRAQGSAAH